MIRSAAGVTGLRLVATNQGECDAKNCDAKRVHIGSLVLVVRLKGGLRLYCTGGVASKPRIVAGRQVVSAYAGPQSWRT